MSSTIALTAGAATVSLAITGANLWGWWKAGKVPKNLAHFGGGYAIGGLASICAGGILGTLAAWAASLANGVGKHAVTASTGQNAAALHHGSAGTLTPGGGMVTALGAVAFAIAWKTASKTIKRRLTGGFFSGATLTLTIGVAGLFAHVVGIVNGIGDSGLGWLNGGAA